MDPPVCKSVPQHVLMLMSHFLVPLQFSFSCYKKIDTTLKECIHLLLTVIYYHTKYGNAHLHMSTHSSFEGAFSCYSLRWEDLHHSRWADLCNIEWGVAVDGEPLSLGGPLARMIKEMTLMSISTYCTPLNKLTDQTMKLSLPSYLLIITGFCLLQHKKSAIKYTSTYCATPNFTKMD